MHDHKKQNLGDGGYCVCPKCNHRAPHKNGVPCQEERCPNCNAKLLREGSDHHKMFLDKKK
ncbi:MAG: ferredoxin [Calditrichaceae bacterium]